MQIKNPKTCLIKRSKLERIAGQYPKIAMFFVGLLVLFIVMSGYQNRHHFTYLKDYAEAKYEVMSLAPLPKMEIDIKFKDFSKISAIRDKLVTQNLHLTNLKHAKTWFPAKITVDGKKYKVKIRLKGDTNAHREGVNKWSFKVKVKKGKKLWAMSRFAIHHPKNQNYGKFTLATNFARRAGIIANKQFHVNVILNGENIGIMNVEDSFSKELLESQKRKEGLIVKVSEDYFWHFFGFMKKETNHPAPEGMYEEFVNDYKKTYLQPYIFNNSSQSKNVQNAQYKKVASLYRSVLAKDMPPSDLFDAQSYAKLFALISLFADETSHLVMQQNIRAYLNPFSGKLEPIAYDWALYETNREMFKGEYLLAELANQYPIYGLGALILSDRKVFDYYLFESQKLANDVLDGLYDDIIENYAKDHRYMMSEFANVVRRENFQAENVKDYIYMRARWVKEHMHDDVSKAYAHLLDRLENKKSQMVNSDTGNLRWYKGAVLQAYLVQKNNRNFVEIANLMPETIEITAIKIDYPGQKAQLIKGVDYPLHISASKGMALPQSIFVPYESVKGQRYDIKLYARMVKNRDRKPRQHLAAIYSLPNSDPFIVKTSLKEQLQQNPFLTLKDKTLVVAAGKWKVDGNIIVPSDYQLQISKGTQLQFGEDNMLISHGPIIFMGQKDSPIIMQGVENQKWRGIAVLEAPKRSHMGHVVIKNLSGVKHKEWSLTGAVSFYRSDITMGDVTIENNISEDALNIIHSSFDIDGLVINNSFSDGFDCDFCEGEIRNSHFNKIGVSGGDGIDVSGSKMTIENVAMAHVSDKAFSIGEGSVVNINNADVSDALAAFVSKDGSSLQVSNSDAREMKIACFMAYQKKEEYGKAWLASKRTKCHQSGQKFISQIGSQMILDGALQPSSKVDVEHFYQTFMKKS